MHPAQKEIVYAAILFGTLLSTRALAQNQQGTPIMFHVTAVRSEDANDWCTTGECTAVRFTVEGRSEANEYILKCVEVLMQKPSPHFTMVCARLHAHNDYEASLGSDAIFFGRPPLPDGTVAYRIVSEREITKPKH